MHIACSAVAHAHAEKTPVRQESIKINVNSQPRVVVVVWGGGGSGVGGGVVLGRVLSIMTYTGRLHPKGVPFSGFKHMKRCVILSCWSIKRPKKANRYILWL